MTASGIVAFATVLMACGGDGSGGQTTIPAQDPVLVSQGETLYQLSCAECHGTDLRGTDKGPSHLSAVYRPGHHADGSFLLAARVGVRQHHWRFGDMPPVPNLSDDEIEAITAFVREQQRVEGFEPYPP